MILPVDKAIIGLIYNSECLEKGQSRIQMRGVSQIALMVVMHSLYDVH
jgi:hypothetical protein